MFSVSSNCILRHRICFRFHDRPMEVNTRHSLHLSDFVRRLDTEHEVDAVVDLVHEVGAHRVSGHVGREGRDDTLVRHRVCRLHTPQTQDTCIRGGRAVERRTVNRGGSIPPTAVSKIR